MDSLTPMIEAALPTLVVSTVGGVGLWIAKSALTAIAKVVWFAVSATARAAWNAIIWGIGWF